MCFSAQASFTSAGLLAVIGTLTLKETYSPKRKIQNLYSEEGTPSTLWYFAVIPLVFAFQQFLEGIVWVTLTTKNDYVPLHDMAAQGFLIIAGIFWPTWIPYVLYKNEKNERRKRILFVMTCLGLVVALFAALSMLILGNTAQIIAHHIAYPIPASSYGNHLFSFAQMAYAVVLAIYVLVTIGASFVSSMRYVWIFGALSFIGFVVAQIFYTHAFGSVWCFFAAIISMVSYIIVRKSPSA